MIKTWQERLDTQYIYPSFEVCKAMEEKIEELRTLVKAKRTQMGKIYYPRYDSETNSWVNVKLDETEQAKAKLELDIELKKHQKIVEQQSKGGYIHMRPKRFLSNDR